MRGFCRTAGPGPRHVLRDAAPDLRSILYAVDHAAGFHGDVAPSGDHDVIDQSDLDQLKRMVQTLRVADVLQRGKGVAAEMIMGQDDHGGVVQKGDLNDPPVRQIHGAHRAAGQLARVTQSHDFGMGVPGALRTPPAHNQAIFYYNRTHRRIGAAYAYREERLFKCELKVVHEAWLFTAKK